MKQITISVSILSLFIIAIGCGPNRKTADTTSNSESVSGTIDTRTDSVAAYTALPLVELPLQFSIDLLNLLSANRNTVRLPSKDSLRFIITDSGHTNADRILELHSLSEDIKPLDKLQLYGTEEVADGRNMITQTFEISNDYRIKVSKHLRDVLIEQLTYVPNAHGLFEEDRDGKTTTVAYDSYDGENYIVQTFVWDYNSNGGLIRKNLKADNYRLTRNGLESTTEN